MGLREFKSRMFAKYYDRMAGAYDERMRDQKRELLSSLTGTVVEIGPGTGANLSLLPKGVALIGIEPNEHMHPQIREKARALGMEVDLRLLPVGKLPLEDQSVDGVLSTLVLCSVPDVPAALEEIYRVLKPGGQFVFWEHVIAPKGILKRTFQHLWTPVQRFLADGCCCNRDFEKSLRESSFGETQVHAFNIPKDAGPPWIRPHVSGVAIRPN